MAFDQAQSPRLGQQLPPELPGIQLLTVNTLPEAAFAGQIVYLTDQQTFSVFDGTAWQLPASGGGGGTGGVTQLFVGPDQPAADHVGDQWFETDTSILYVWDGTAWQVSHDPRYDALADQVATNEAATIQSLTHLQDQLDGKVDTFYATVQPATADAGDLWFNTSTNKLYRYDGTTWNEITDPAAVKAIADAGIAQSTADGKITTYYSSAAPWADGATGHAADAGDLWVDSNDSNKLYRWSGTAWILVTDSRIATLVSDMTKRPPHIESTSAPGSTANVAGTIWERYDTLSSTSRKLLGAWRGLGGTSWVPISIDPTYIPVLDIATGTAGSLAVSRLLVTDMTDLLVDSTCQGFGWTPTSGSYIDHSYPGASGIADGVMIFPPNNAYQEYHSNLFPVVAGDSLLVSTVVSRIASADGAWVVRVWWADANGNNLTSTPYTDPCAGSSSTTPGAWTYYDNAVTVPAGATQAAVIVIRYSGASTGYWGFDTISVRRRANGRLIVDGAIDGKTITGALIQTAASGARVWMDSTGIYASNGAALTYQVTAAGGSGVFSGTLSAATGTFRGALSGATGTFAGSLSAASGTFAGSLSAASGTFTGALSGASGTFTGTVTGGIVQTAASGNRLLMRNDTAGGILQGWTGDGAEDLPGAVNPNIIGTSGARQGTLDLWSPKLSTTNGFDRAHLYLLSRSANGNTAPSIEADAIINANKAIFVTGDTKTSGTLYSMQETGTAAGDAEFGPGGGLRRKGSTQRIKKNLQDLGIAPSKIAGLRTLTYQFDDEEFYGTSRYPGLIAEDLDAAGLGDFVIYDEQGLPSGVRYSEFAAIGVVKLTQVVISLTQQVNQLQTQVTALAAKINKTP